MERHSDILRASIEHKIAYEKAYIIKYVHYPNSINAYLLFHQIINPDITDEQLERIRGKFTPPDRVTTKNAKTTIEAVECASESIFQLPHDSDVDATKLLLTIYTHIINPSTELKTNLDAQIAHIVTKVPEKTQQTVLERISRVQNRLFSIYAAGIN